MNKPVRNKPVRINPKSLVNKPRSLEEFRAEMIVAVVREREDGLLAITRCLEHRLAELCNEGGSPPDDAPLTEWHLSRVLFGLLDSPEHERCVASYLGIKD